MEIYQPSDDSYLFEEFLKEYFANNKVKSYLDMGTGSGILAKTALKFLDGEKIIAADINPQAIANLKSEDFKKIESNLFEKIEGDFDLITFNAPYLPLDKREPEDSRVATTGGKMGDEISLEFIKQAKKHLNDKGKIFLLVSSLTPMDRLKKFNPKAVKKKRVFAEDLIIFEFH